MSCVYSLADLTCTDVLCIQIGRPQMFNVLYIQVTSQNPYAEVLIGKPHVYTVDINNHTQLRLALEDILKENEVTVSYLPAVFNG